MSLVFIWAMLLLSLVNQSLGLQCYGGLHCKVGKGRRASSSCQLVSGCKSCARSLDVGRGGTDVWLHCWIGSERGCMNDRSIKWTGHGYQLSIPHANICFCRSGNGCNGNGQMSSPILGESDAGSDAGSNADLAVMAPKDDLKKSWTCRDRASIDVHWRCDGFKDCDQGEDEEKCEEYECEGNVGVRRGVSKGVEDGHGQHA
jgi:hypothetical protein